MLLAPLMVLAGMSGASVSGAERAPEPYLAIRTGLKCSACHVNRTGGGGRSAYGSLYAQTQLPRHTQPVKNRAVTDFLAVGWDLRTSASGTLSASTPRTALELAEANAYVEARLIERWLAAYVDQTLGPGAASAREAFAVVDLPLAGYAKAGKFLLPYGLRLPDNAEFVRAQTGFSYQTPDVGLELGWEPGPWSVFLALSNGTAGAAENNDGKQLTGSVILVRRRFRLGGSASRNQGAGLERRDVVGGFAGAVLGPLALLGELDRIVERSQVGSTVRQRRQLAGYLEGDLLAARGINAKLTYGYFDQNLDVPEDQRVRLRVGLELFPVAFLRAAAFYTGDFWIPQAATPDRVGLELHLYF